MPSRIRIPQVPLPEPLRTRWLRPAWWLRVPKLRVERAQIRANLVHHALMSLLFASLAVVPVLASLAHGRGPRLMIAPLVILAVAPGVLLLLHRGKPRTAAWLLVLVLWALIFGMALTAGGTLAPVLAMGYLIVVLTALTLGRWASLGLLGMVVLGYFGLVGVEAAGWLPPPSVLHTAFSRSITTAAIGAALVAILWRSGADVERVLEARAETQRELERQVSLRTQELEESHAALRAANATVEAMNRTLEAKVAERTESLAEALQQAQAAGEAKSLFLARMGHELRTPLNQIMLHLQLVESAWPGQPDPETVDDFARMHASGRHLEALIQDVLMYCDLSAGRMVLERQPMDVGAICEEVVQACRPLAEAKGVRVEVEVDEALPSRCLGDEARLRRVLREVVFNAVKFTDQGEVRIRVAQAVAREGLTFEVADTGMGVAEDRLASIFEPFEQADGSLQRRYGGTGLGLALVKRLVGLMGGEIRIESTPGTGTRVRMEMELPQV